MFCEAVEITLKFQLKRGDSEVDNLFKTIENITNIKYAEIDRFKQTVQANLPKTTALLEEALVVSGSFAGLENKYKEVYHDRYAIILIRTWQNVKIKTYFNFLFL